MTRAALAAALVIVVGTAGLLTLGDDPFDGLVVAVVGMLGLAVVVVIITVNRGYQTIRHLVRDYFGDERRL